MDRKRILLVCGIVIVFVGVIYLNYAAYQVSVKERNQNALNAGPGVEVLRDYKGDSKIHSILVEMHEMANTLIVADKVWGELPITEDRIKRLLEEIPTLKAVPKEEMDIMKSKLIEILLAWQHKDYSDAVRQHNYIWRELGGEFGRAYDLREEYKKLEYGYNDRIK